MSTFAPGVRPYYIKAMRDAGYEARHDSTQDLVLHLAAADLLELDFEERIDLDRAPTIRAVVALSIDALPDDVLEGVPFPKHWDETNADMLRLKGNPFNDSQGPIVNVPAPRPGAWRPVPRHMEEAS